MPIVRAYINTTCAISEVELRIACEELISSALHLEEDEGNLTPDDIVVIIQEVERLGFDVLIDIEAMPYPERIEMRASIADGIREIIENVMFGGIYGMAVSLKLVIDAWSSATASESDGRQYDMSTSEAFNRAARRIEFYQEHGHDGLELHD